MNIKFLTRRTEFGEEVDFGPLLQNRSVHYVSVAMPGLTVASTYIESSGSFSVAQRNQFMLMVNRAQETGTLYPGVNITLLPSPTANYSGFDNNVYNDGDYSEPEVIDHIKDAFKANSEYIKSYKMYFDFRNLSVSEEHYLICLKKTIKEFQKQESDLPEVITWFPPDMSTKSALFAFLLS